MVKFLRKFWQMVSGPFTQKDCVWNICKGPSGFLAVGKDGLVLFSSTGTEWLKINVPTLENLFGCVYSKVHDLFVVVGTHVILTSKDLLMWEAIEVKADQLFKVVSIGKWLVSIDYKIGVWVSMDGIRWEQIGLKVDREWRCLSAKGNIAYAGSKNGSTYKIYEKDDQIVIEKNGHGVDGSGACLVSDTGVIWAAHTVRKNNVNLFSLFGETTIMGGDIQGDKAFLVGSDGTVIYSFDAGDTWKYYSTGQKGGLTCCVSDGVNLIIGGERINKEWLAPLVYIPLSEMTANGKVEPPTPTNPPAPGTIGAEILEKINNARHQLDLAENLINKI